MTNYAIATGRPHPSGGHLFVFDIDNHASWRELKEKLKIPETYMVVTPRGGKHFYVRTSEALPNSTSKLAFEIDTRGRGGYVVAPGSMIDNKKYVLHNTTPNGVVPMLPIETERIVKEMLGAGTENNIQQTDEINNRFKAYIDSVDIIPQGERNDGLYKLSTRLGDLGASGRELWAALSYANLKIVSPPVNNSELKAIFKSSQSSRQNPVGIDDMQGTVDVSALLEKLNGPSKKDEVKEEKALALPELPPFGKTIIKAILDRAVRKNPELATAATISLACAAATKNGAYIDIYGRKVFPNIFQLLLAPTGGGKETPMSFVTYMGIDFDFCLSGDVTSAPGLYDVFLNYKIIGKGKDKIEEISVRPDKLHNMLIKDECSGLLDTVNNNKTLGENLSNLLCELATKTESPILQRNYSKKQTAQRPSLPFSRVSLLWATTLSGFTTSSSIHNLASGLLGRFIIIKSDKRPREELKRSDKKITTTESVKNKIKKINEMFESQKNHGRVDISPPLERLDEYEDKIQEISDYLNSTYSSDNISPRLSMFVEKVAMGMAFLESIGCVASVTTKHLDMAQNYVEWTIKSMGNLYEDIGKDKAEHQLDALLAQLAERVKKESAKEGSVYITRLKQKSKRLRTLNRFQWAVSELIEQKKICYTKNDLKRVSPINAPLR